MKFNSYLGFGAFILAMITFFCSAGLPAEKDIIQEGTFFLKARHSGKYISVKNAGQENGSILWQWDYHGKAQQQFKFKSAGGGYYFIQAVHSGKYVSVKNAGTENGVIIWQWDYHGKAQQQFKLQKASGNYYYIQARNSGRYLSIKDAGTKNGTILWQWDYHGRGQQQFEMIPVSTGGGSITIGNEFKRAIQGAPIGCGDDTFFDPIDGGTCWTCPEGYNRTIFSVKSDKACERPGGEKFAKAIRHSRGSGLLGTDCSNGQFWDPNGYCYSCPKGYSRTAHPVTSSKACSQKVHADYRPARLFSAANECKKGYFFDIGTDKCWTCPDGFQRTVFPVDGDKACEKISVTTN